MRVRRRSDRARVLVVVVRHLRHAAQRDPGLRRYRFRHHEHRRREDRGRHHPEDEGDHRRSSARPAGRHGRGHGGRGQARDEGDRGRVPGSRGAAWREEGGHAGPLRRLQLQSEQVSLRRRGWHVRHQRCGHAETGAGALVLRRSQRAHRPARLSRIRDGLDVPQQRYLARRWDVPNCASWIHTWQSRSRTPTA